MTKWSRCTPPCRSPSLGASAIKSALPVFRHHGGRPRQLLGSVVMSSNTSLSATCRSASLESMAGLGQNRLEAFTTRAGKTGLAELLAGNTRCRPNTVNLGGQYGDRVFDRRGWLGWVAVFGSFDWPVAHFAFDDPGVAACAAFGQGSGEDLNDRLLVSFVDALGGKARGLSGRFGGWRGGRG